MQQHLPQAVLTADRTEHSSFPLSVIEGTLPTDLSGHLFFMSLAGHVETNGLPSPDGTHMLNSDGMLHRLDLSPSGILTTCRLVRTPCFFADDATQWLPEYQKLKFYNLNLVRASPELGFRELTNTAFMTICDPPEVPRLFATYDAGRPYELDTVSLKPITAVGSYAEWQPEGLPALPLPPILSSAHPVYDAHTKEMFSVNYGRSSLNLTLGSLPLANQLLLEGGELLEGVARLLSTTGLQPYWEVFPALFSSIQQLRRRMSSRRDSGPMPHNFANIIRWRNNGSLETWRLVHENGSPVHIDMTTHQLAVTRHYLVIMDTAFKMGIDQVYNRPFPGAPLASRMLHELTSLPNKPYARIYLVKRSKLDAPHTRSFGAMRAIEVQEVTLPMEAIHFLADYDDSEDRIHLHVSHTCASDIAEQVRTFDLHHLTRKAVSKRVVGMFVNAMDLNRIGSWTICARRLKVIESKLFAQDDLTWGLSFPTSSDFVTDRPLKDKQTFVYWSVVGVFPELYTEFIYQLYKDYPNRMVPLEEISRLSDGSWRSSCLLKVDARTNALVDQYQCPPGVMLSTPQFVPKAGSSDPEACYLFTTAFVEDHNEIWCFDGNQLKSGPVVKLRYPSAFAFSIHSAWLPTIGPRQANYQVSVVDDIVPRLHTPLVQSLFEREVFPHFPDPASPR